MKSASVSEIRRYDEQAIATAWTPGTPRRGDEIMRIAATQLAAFVHDVASRMPARPDIIAVCGKGNNGGDTRLAAEALSARGYATRIVPVPDDPAVRALPPVDAFPSPCIVLDGILGIGLTGAPRHAAATAIAFVNALGQRPGTLVVAVDIPSGLEADTGRFAAPDAVVRADFTVSMGLPKRCFAHPEALACCGSVRVVPIAGPAVPESANPGDSAEPEIFTEADCTRLLNPRRAWDAYKGSFGRVRLLAGSTAYPGAAVLAACGALRGGAGLTVAHAPAPCVPALVAAAPELIVRGYDAPALTETVLPEILRQIEPGDVLAVGPGLSPEAWEAVRILLVVGSVQSYDDWLAVRERHAYGTNIDALVADASHFHFSALRGAVFDADALNAVAPLETALPPNCVLTPHPGEAARLLGCPVAEVTGDRMGALRRLVDRSGSVVVLKGAGTLVGAPGKPVTLIPAGNPGMAKGGSGDVLCGIIAALLAQGLEPYAAACVGAYRHACAADAALLRHSCRSLLPSDLLAAL